ncbi:TonB-dependent receptor SusC [Pedobacter sp. Bi27]|uniref:SusC/RagA family TonB-linked outer membrane protein n=1 Tax=unclassified Pedobacter TaxID=2628915 RepID=UPI001D69466E|nr:MULTISPECIES: TonB-dependent receptor [unclassified Pedobacter]CAH0124092.1 TonB-dependent receptor SusC [Pedobacter sp. Bi36]CAH0176830.1 TonB-dependent receptor SusC [Pedobacter sp. Bi126]CAH0284182.1 TonB-dependent receptor SusC [Pedobacter sp. Bi27]
MKKKLPKKIPLHQQGITLRSILKFLIYLVITISSLTVSAQTDVTVRGIVKDTVGGLPGVNVKVSGTNRGISTDEFGRYTIKLPRTGKLLFSLVGYKPKNVAIANYDKNAEGVYVINVTLSSDANSLEEVAVVGFGTQKKTSVISSITAINPKELKGPTSNLTTMMAGRVAGMIAYQRSGEPGADNAQFFIRGLGTFGAGKQDPLILIDGIESSQNDMARLQPDDISSFNVLKDATASAVYGARGANGVVLILTKSGVAGQTKFGFRAESSLSSNTKNFQFADNVTYMKLANEAALTRNRLAILPYLQTKIDATAAGENELLYPNNNWIEQLIKDYTTNQRYNINISGGGTKASYYIAGTYNIDNGVLKVADLNNFNSNIKLKNYSVRSNVNINLTNTTEAIIRVYGQFDDYTGPVGGGGATFNRAIWSNPVMFPAVYPASLSPFSNHPLFGNAISPRGGLYMNPFAEMVKGYQDKNASTLQTQIEIKQDLKFITPGLTARMMSYARRYSYFDISRAYSPFYYSSTEQPDKSIGLTLINGGGALSIGQVGTEYLGYSEGKKDLNSTFYAEFSANYNRTFKEKHAVGVMLITTMRNYLAANPGSLQLSLPSRNQGVSGRATYGYDNRYLAEFNFGYNGSERFAENTRFGFFPSFGLGYIISNENYFKPLTSVINSLKLRATFGLVGNDQIGNDSDRFFYLSEVNMNNGTFGSSFGEDGLYYRDGISISRYSNPFITWEKSKQTNIGLDMTLFNSLNLTFDIYKNERSNILTDRTFIPSSMGLQASVRANTNKAESKGVDFSASYNKSFHNGMFLQMRGNFTYATNKILIYDEPSFSTKEAYRYHIGLPTTQSFGYIAERLFIDDAEAKNSPVQFAGVPGLDYGGGDIKYRDVNGDGIISDVDQVPIGLPTSPEIVYGFGGTFGFKGFDISAFLQGSARSSFFINPGNISPFVLNNETGNPNVTQNGLLEVIANSHWSEQNRDSYAFWPRLSPNFVNNNTRTSTWWMRNGSFLRLKSVELGYNLQTKLQKRLGLNSARVYVNATNLSSFSNFKLWDPEMGGNGLGYPVQTVYNLGLNVSF